MTSTARQDLDRLLAQLDQQRVQRVLEFARFLSWEQERSEWQEFGKRQFAQA